MVTAESNIIECASEAEWLEARLGLGIGGSESSAALGANDFCSPWKLYMIKTGQLPPDDETLQMKVGKVLEPMVRDLASESLGAKVINPGSYTIRRSPQHEHLFCTLDGIVPECQGAADLFGEAGLDLPAGDGIAQIKAVNAFAAKDYAGPQEWPLMYQIQTQHELLCSGLQWGVLPVLIGNHKFKMLPFVANERFQQALVKATAEFWQRVKDRNPPEADGSDATTEAIKRAFKEQMAEGPTVDLPEDADAWADQLAKAQADKKDAEEREREAKNRLCAAIGENTYGICPDGRRFSWKTQSRKEHVVKESTFRVLRMTK